MISYGSILELLVILQDKIEGAPKLSIEQRQGDLVLCAHWRERGLGAAELLGDDSSISSLAETFTIAYRRAVTASDMANGENRTHYLKVEHSSFLLHLSDEKMFSIRKNDRHYQKGERIVLREITDNGLHTDRSIECIITCVITYQQKEGYVVLGLRKA